tara:strand:+ start:141 stop:494 length:354 start_codon:yes stop_codon:yes gene_type:complete
MIFERNQKMPSFEMIMPNGKKIDLTDKVKSAKTETDLKTVLKTALKTDLVSYAPMFNFGDYETQGNGERYATEAEAEKSARARFNVWTMPTGYFVKETNDPVNYRFSTTFGRVMIES